MDPCESPKMNQYDSLPSSPKHNLQRIICSFIILVMLVDVVAWPSDNKETNTLISNPGSFKSKVDTNTSLEHEPVSRLATSHTRNDALAAGPDLSPSTPPLNQINCQARQETPGESIERQEQETRQVEKGVVGLEIAQGAIEITLGAIRIAAAATTSDVLRREDNIASSRASLGLAGSGITPVPEEILGPIAADDASLVEKQACGDSLPSRRASGSQLDDPYRNWNIGFNYRMKRSPAFANGYWPKFYPTPIPSSLPKHKSRSFNAPNLDDAERLLSLLENLLRTNDKVLRLLGMELPPLTTSGALLLRQYKEKVDRIKLDKMDHAPPTSNIAKPLEAGDREQEIGQVELSYDKWITSSTDQEPIKMFTDELARLKRAQRSYKIRKNNFLSK